MANDLEIFGKSQALPSHVAKFFDETEENVIPQASTPTLSYGGKVWAITLGGEKKPLMKRDDEGDETPIPVMRVVVLDYAKERGRAYYEGSYDPDNTGSPVCWSDDGVKPDASVAEPQALACAKCPMAVKGSRVTDSGKAVTACSQHRMLAVVPTKKLDMTPLRMKIAITSDYDKQSPEMEKQGWRAFRQMIDFLHTNGAKNTAAFSIKMRFDPTVDYPKVMFSPERWLNEEEIAQVAGILKEHDLKALLSGSRGRPAAEAPDTASEFAAIGHKPVADEDDEPAPKAKAAKPKAKPAPVDDEDEPAPKAKAAKPKAKPAPVDDDEDGVLDAVAVDDEDEIPEFVKETRAKSTPKAKAKAAPVEDDDDDEPAGGSGMPEDVEALLSEWDDD